MLPLGRLALPALGVLLACGSLAVAGPAAADVTGSTSTPDAVLYDECQELPITYDVAVSPGTQLWRLEIQVYDPNGVASEGTVVNSAANAPTTGTVYHQVCGSDSPGTYTVRATGFYELLPAVQTPFALPDTTFRVRRVATRTELRDKSLGHRRHRVVTTVREETPSGFARSDGVQVRLERLVNGQWRKVRGSTLTTVRGRATTVVRERRGTQLRAVVPQRHNYDGSSSAPLTL